MGATCDLRIRYRKVARQERTAPRLKRALRNHANATLECVTQILDEVLEGGDARWRGGSAAQGEHSGATQQTRSAVDDLSDAGAQRLAQAGPDTADFLKNSCNSKLSHAVDSSELADSITN